MKIVLLIVMVSLHAVAGAIILPQNFKADFTQKITNPKKSSIKYSGKVQFSNKDLLKWRYLTPTKKEVCTDGKELLVVDHDLEQVSNYMINKGFNLSKILAKAKVHSKNIYVTKYENKNYTIQVDSKGQIQSIAYFDDLDNKVQISFKKMKYGKGNLPSKSMTCNYPENYDMIRG